MSSYGSFIYENEENCIKYINDKLEIDFNDSENNIDTQTVEKLMDIWNEINDQSFDKNFCQFIDNQERIVNFNIIKTAINSKQNLLKQIHNVWKIKEKNPED